MNKNDPKLTAALVFLFFISAPIFFSTLFNFIKDKKQVAEEKIVEKTQLQNKEKETEKTYLLGQFDPSTMEGFIPVPIEYSVSGYKMYLRKETLNSFIQMAEAAEQDGVKLRIASATRNFEYQKNIWNTKWSSFSKSIPDELTVFKKILEYSAIPGTSRHHWGTEIDLNNANVEYFQTEQGEKVYDWLVKNAWEYGFCQTYNSKSIRKTGYNEEKWHWSYLPLSINFTNEYKNLIKPEDIKGFQGDEYVAGQDIINNYVLSINPACL